MGARIDLTGRRYGRLTVTGFAGRLKTEMRWACVCDCGGQKVVGRSNLIGGRTVSCGCWQAVARAKTNVVHGQSKTLVHRVWRQMLARCHSPEDSGYHNYGGRGIYVCERWRASFVNFIADMGPRPAGMTLDRVDNDGPYAPENCRWATNAEQSRNRRTNRNLIFRGQTRCVSDWAAIVGVSATTICRRLDGGMSIEDALTKPPTRRARRGDDQLVAGVLLGDLVLLGGGHAAMVEEGAR
jgi:hypothetical protein